jgi:anti-sigma regulatory factor (Ser/Thr protein kinase)
MENRHDLETRDRRRTAPLRVELAPGDLAAIAPLRAQLREALHRWGLAALADTAELLATELAGNALRHTATGAVLTARLAGPDRLRVEVGDGDRVLPRPRPGADPVELETGGRGLLLVAALADAWGARLTGTGKTTWFVLVDR